MGIHFLTPMTYWCRGWHLVVSCRWWPCNRGSKFLQVNFAGTSIRRSPLVCVMYRVSVCGVWLVSVSYHACVVPSCARGCSLFGLIRRMCPTHFSLRDLIAANTSKVLVLLLASSCTERSVMWDNILLFTPFSSLHSLSSISQASQPYMNFEQTPTL